jgi:predicted negative regulator of RcsB-dependent stress response
MAKQQSAFDLKHIEETAAVETSGILDQLNLPQPLTDFLQKNQRTIWIVVGIVAAVVTVVSLYGSYRGYTLNKAAKAYDQALVLDGDQKKVALEKVADKYGSTPSAIWSRVELAHMDQAAGELTGAIDKLTAVNSGLKENSLLKPLILVNLGGLYEQNKQPEKALSVYQELKTLKGFESVAVNSLGRVYEAQGNNEKAAQMFQQYLTMTTSEETAPQQDDPVRAMVRAGLNRLQHK